MIHNRLLQKMVLRIFGKYKFFRQLIRTPNTGKDSGFMPDCFGVGNLRKTRTPHRLGMLFLALCLVTACAGWEEDYADDAEGRFAQSSMGPGGGGMSQRGMSPDVNMVEQMRASRMSSLSRSPGISAIRAMPESGGQVSSQTSRTRQPKEDKTLLEAGIEAYNVSDYKGAVEKLRQFLDKYPASDSTPEGLFFLGESYYRQKEYQKAMTIYKKIDVNFSPYPRAGEALYKAGKCLEALGNSVSAVRVYKKVANKYPSFNPDSIKD